MNCTMQRQACKLPKRMYYYINAVTLHYMKPKKNPFVFV